MIARQEEGDEPNHVVRGKASGVHPCVVQPSRPDPTPPSRVSWRPRAFAKSGPAFLLDVLARVESCKGTRALRYSDARNSLATPNEPASCPPVGAVVSCGGEVCLVALAQDDEPLAARLRRADPSVAEAIRDALARAKVDGRPLGAALSALGERPAEVVRRALHEQFVEGILSLSRWEPETLVETAHDLPRRLPTMLTAFIPLDIYWSAVRALPPIEGDAAQAWFEEASEDVDRAALIAWGDAAGGMPVLVAARGFEPSSVGEIANLSMFVENTLRPPAFVRSGEEPTIVSLGRGNEVVLGIAAERHMAFFVGARRDLRARVVAQAR